MFSVSYIYLMECRYIYFKPTSADAYFEQPHHQQRARTAVSFSTRQEQNHQALEARIQRFKAINFLKNNLSLTITEKKQNEEEEEEDGHPTKLKQIVNRQHN